MVGQLPEYILELLLGFGVLSKDTSTSNQEEPGIEQQLFKVQKTRALSSSACMSENAFVLSGTGSYV